MADFEIKDPPEFSAGVRRFEVTDQAHADLFNAVTEKLINNDAYLKKEMESGPIVVAEEEIPVESRKAGHWYFCVTKEEADG